MATLDEYSDACDKLKEAENEVHDIRFVVSQACDRLEHWESAKIESEETIASPGPGVKAINPNEWPPFKQIVMAILKAQAARNRAREIYDSLPQNKKEKVSPPGVPVLPRRR